VTFPDWLWIPITIGAAVAQTTRNAAQRHLTVELGTLGATLVRFLYGLPFAVLWLVLARTFTSATIPAAPLPFYLWVLLGALSQIAATAFLLRAMHERNFALGIAYSKSEVIQVAVFALVFLGDRVSGPAAIAIACATIGVMLLSPADKVRPIHALAVGWTSRTALLGLAAGALFAMSAVGFRGATITLHDTSFVMAGAFTLVVAQLMQTFLLGGWLMARERPVVGRVLRAWRVSLFAGFMGAAASAGWFTAFAIEPVAHVRTLGLVDLAFSYAVSRKLFRERLTSLQTAGMCLLGAGVVLIMLARV
jgi:uncharacterized membrane protein